MPQPHELAYATPSREPKAKIPSPMKGVLAIGWVLVIVISVLSYSAVLLPLGICAMLLFTIASVPDRGNPSPPGRSPRRMALLGFGLILLAGFVFLQRSDRPGAERAYRVICGSNLRQIGFSLPAYAEQYGNVLPPHLGLLLHADLTPDVFICRSSGAEVPAPGPTFEDLIEQIALPQHNSYVYRAAGQTWPLPDGFVIAHDRPTNHRGRGINVLFSDGTVEWRTDFQSLLDQLDAGQNPPTPD